MPQTREASYNEDGTLREALSQEEEDTEMESDDVHKLLSAIKGEKRNSP